jgi:predicted dithiol-disulfide oxidoreductase (DUF899 family)
MAAARKALLVKEKELTRLRYALSAERRRLPWVKIEKVYVSIRQRARSRWPIYSTDEASSWSITSC